MEEKCYVAVGQWRHGLEGSLGIKMYQWKDGSLSLVETVREDITAGQICIDRRRGVLYAVDEAPGEPSDSKGSRICGFLIDPETGRLRQISEKRTMGSYPCCISLDAAGGYLVVSHNGDHEAYDGAPLVLFRVNGDGSLGDICDMFLPPSGGPENPRAKAVGGGKGIASHAGVMAHLHSVTCSPDSSLYAACDMGMGIIYTFHIDRERGKLVLKERFFLEPELLVRYGAFHPVKPYFYANCEHAPYVLSFQYDPVTGRLEETGRALTVPDGGNMDTGGNDLLIHPGGKYLYCSNISDTISVLEIDDGGRLRLKQNIDCRGIRPRCICLSPDHQYLLSGNNRSESITYLRIHEDGTLSQTDKETNHVLPSAVRTFCSDHREIHY